MERDAKFRMKRRTGGVPRRDLTRRSEARNSPMTVSLVHVTAVGFGREIIDGRQIEPRPCPVFKQNLAYFFALRPSYRLKDGGALSSQINRFPFVLIIDPATLPAPHHVYPFDTGGACSGVFSRLDPTIPLEDYRLPPTLQAAADHIDWAFGGLESYLTGDLRNDLASGVPMFETSVHGFIDIAKMATGGWNDEPDGRASAVEVAYAENIALKGRVRLAVFPRQYLEDGDVVNRVFLTQLVELGIPFKTYDWQPNRSPDEFQGRIAEIVRDHYHAAGELA